MASLNEANLGVRSRGSERFNTQHQRRLLEPTRKISLSAGIDAFKPF
jgi:hypothetical protein